MRQPYPLLYTAGDSISMGWLPYLIRRIAAEASRLPSARYTVARAPGGGTSELLRAELAEWLRGHEPAVIACNCGLHDLGRTGDRDWQRNVPPDRYERNLAELIESLREAAASARLIWLTTTPIIRARMDETEGYRHYKRDEPDVDAYNAIANAVMEGSEVEVLDLHGAVVRAGTERLMGPDGVHFAEDGYRLLGDLIGWRIIGEELRPAEEEDG